MQALKRYLRTAGMEQPSLKQFSRRAVQQACRTSPGPAGTAYLDPDVLIPAHTAHQIFILLPLAQTVLCKLLRVADFLPRRLEILLLQLLALPQDLLNSDLQA